MCPWVLCHAVMLKSGCFSLPGPRLLLGLCGYLGTYSESHPLAEREDSTDRKNRMVRRRKITKNSNKSQTKTVFEYRITQ